MNRALGYHTTAAYLQTISLSRFASLASVDGLHMHQYKACTYMYVHTRMHTHINTYTHARIHPSHFRLWHQSHINKIDNVAIINYDHPSLSMAVKNCHHMIRMPLPAAITGV